MKTAGMFGDDVDIWSSGGLETSVANLKQIRERWEKKIQFVHFNFNPSGKIE